MDMLSGYAGWECGFFVAMILAMAGVPLISAGWWRKWYPVVTLAIALPALIIVWNRSPSALGVVAEEYISFILLLGALYIISGGILIETPARGRPLSNATFLLIGALLTNVLGTTGASVVLIRPLIRANAWRKHATHVFVFFIFMVSNIGGLLLPLGDPPLFLGFLRGVPFLWTLKLLPLWAVANGVLLVLFLGIDALAMRRESGENDGVAPRRFGIHGAMNGVLLLAVVSSLFLPMVPRLLVMAIAAGISIRWTPGAIREENDFTYHPILEVAVLFAGIFTTIIPVQAFLHNSPVLQWVSSPGRYFWVAGGLSTVLDNAPTYLIFSENARMSATPGVPLVSGVPEPLLLAISAGCVLMGSVTYIGNGPNLMVKAICEDEGIAMPSFMGYLVWSLAVLIPLFALISRMFFS